ncbi:MAG: hypothetical protein LBU77_06045 [Clostridiales bacterium]|jgi:hypothetical protein|nr:hypothetical protein [Clostridiales bacterium]
MEESNSNNLDNYDLNGGGSKKSALPKVLIGAVAAVILAAAGIVIFALPALNNLSPAAYLKNAFEKTVENMSEDSLGLPKFEQYDGKTIALSAAASLDYLDDTAFPYAATAAVGSSFESDFKLDKQGKKAMLDLSVNANGIQLDGNRFYIAKNMIAVSVPLLYNQQSFITLDPATLARDWNISPYGAMGKIPEDFDVPGFIDELFSIAEQSGASAYTEELTAMSDTLVNAMTITLDNNQKTEWNGSETTLNRVTVTFPAASVSTFYAQLADFYDRIAADSTAMMPPESVAEYNEVISQMTDALRSVSLSEDLVLHVYCNADQLITKLEMPTITCTYTDAATETETETALGFSAELMGTKNLLDKIDATLTITVDGQEADINITRNAANENGAVDDRVTTALSVAGIEVGSLGYNFHWAKEASDDQNMTLTLTAGSADSANENYIKITGNLFDNEGETVLADGTFSTGTSQGDLMTLGISGGIRQIEPDEIGFDEADSISLFDLDPMELFGNLMPLFQQ